MYELFSVLQTHFKVVKTPWAGGAINFGEKGQHKILVNYNKYR